MPKKTPTGSPFQSLEEEAWHAFREWPILLVMRRKELALHVQAVLSPGTPRTEAAPADDRSSVEPAPVKGKSS